MIDFKRGNGHPVDPRKTVGSWSAAGGNPATITHVYGTLSFTWKVVQNPSSVSFCTTAGVEHVRAFVVPINASLGCNGIYPP